MQPQLHSEPAGEFKVRPAGSPEWGPWCLSGTCWCSATAQKRGCSSHPGVGAFTWVLPSSSGGCVAPERKRRRFLTHQGSLLCLSWACKSAPGLAQVSLALDPIGHWEELPGKRKRSLRWSVLGLGTF